MKPEMFNQYIAETLSRINDFKTPEASSPITPDRITCHAGNCSFTINWQGEMRPCVMLTKPAASVFDIGFENAWRYITEETDKILLSSKCAACAFKCLCRTCAASALLETGNFDGTPDYMCRYTKESYKQICSEINLK